MATEYTAEEIIDSIRNLGMVPDAGTLGGEDADILKHINEECALTLIPHLMAIKEEYLVVTTQQALGASTKKYRIPTRAIGDRFRYVRWLDTDKKRNYSELLEIQATHHNEYNWESVDKPQGYYLEGNYLCLIGSGFSGYLELSWYFRPGSLVLSTEARKITVVDTATKTITMASNAPTAWSATNKFDIHSTESGAEIKDWSMVATSVNGTGTEDHITFSNELDGSVVGTHPIEVGDWVCLEKECALLPIPYDLVPLLIRAVSVRMAEAQGDAEDVRVEHDLFQEAKKAATPILTNRSGKPYRLRGCGGIFDQMRGY